MDAIGFVGAIGALGALAVRFGQISRRDFRAREHGFAIHGVTRCDLIREQPAATAIPAASDEPLRGRTASQEAYPTLAFIERALGHAMPVLTTAADASALEIRARELVVERWSDSVWTTGVVPEAAFRCVLAELAPGILLAPNDAGPVFGGVELPVRVPAETAVASGMIARRERAALAEIAAPSAAT